MEKEVKCTLKKHSDIKAVTFCVECNKYMCNKCRQLHSDLFDNHQLMTVNDKNNNNIFTGKCQEENHLLELEYYCNTHNQLCCEKCISKFKKQGNGKHANCKISLLEEIKGKKRSKLKENIKHLEKLSKNINKEIDKLKTIIEKADKEKEDLKVKIQKIFTRIRSAINEREDKLLTYVDKKFDKCSKEKESIKEALDLPKLIETNLNKGNLINKEWDKNKINSLINDCASIENNISKINSINNKLININSNNNKINFFPNDYEINQLLESLRNFGKISDKEYKYAFRECPNNLEENKKYIVGGIDNNILIKVGKNCWTGIMCKKPFEKNKKHIWKMKILESHKDSNSIIVGVAPENFDITKSTYSNCGWYLCCCCGHLFSGTPHNYKDKKIDDKFNLKSKVITFIMDMTDGSFKYALDSRKPVEMYSNIPTDKPLFPIVFLKYKDDKVIISENNWKQIMFKKFIKEREMENKKEKEKNVKPNIKKEDIKKEKIKKVKVEDEDDSEEDEKEPINYIPRGNRGFFRPRIRGNPFRGRPPRGFRYFRPRGGRY